VKVKVTIQFKGRPIQKYLNSSGVSGRIKDDMLVFEDEFDRASYLLTELRHRFPIGFVQGWTEPA
jgi:hypothetical protein